MRASSCTAAAYFAVIPRRRTPEPTSSGPARPPGRRDLADPLPGTSERGGRESDRYEERGLCCRFPTAVARYCRRPDAGQSGMSAVPVTTEPRTPHDRRHPARARLRLGGGPRRRDRRAGADRPSRSARSWSSPVRSPGSSWRARLPSSGPIRALDHAASTRRSAGSVGAARGRAAARRRPVRRAAPGRRCRPRAARAGERAARGARRACRRPRRADRGDARADAAIEATVATLAESLEGVTDGVEEAFKALQTGTAELARRSSSGSTAPSPSSPPARRATRPSPPSCRAGSRSSRARLEAAGDAERRPTSCARP